MVYDSYTAAEMAAWINNFYATTTAGDIIASLVLLTIMAGLRKKGGSNSFFKKMFGWK